MKRLLGALLLFLTSTCCAQLTSVSATVTDSSGQIWINGTWQVAFVPTPGKPGPFLWQGSPIPTSYLLQSGTINGSGQFSVNVPDNTFVSPPGSQWVFTLCPNASSACGTFQSAISGSSLNISSNLTASIPPISVQASNIMPSAYANSQISAPPPRYGAIYLNTESLTPYFWNGTAWVAFGSGSMVYPGAGIAKSPGTGGPWSASYTPSGTGNYVPTLISELPYYEIPGNTSPSDHDLQDSGLGTLLSSLTTTEINSAVTAGGNYFDGGTFVIPTSFPDTSHIPFANPYGAGMLDLRTDIPAQPVSVKTYGAQCDEAGMAGPAAGTATTTQGSNQVTVNSWGYRPSVAVGESLAIVGSVDGVPTAWEPIVTGFTGSTITTYDNAPFSVSAASFTYGHDDTAPIQNLVAADSGHPNVQFAGTISIPDGSCFAHTIQVGGTVTIEGQDRRKSGLVGFPGEDLLATSDPSNPNYIGYAIQDLNLSDLDFTADDRIDARNAWVQVVTYPSSCNANYTSCTVTTTDHAGLSRHFARQSIHSNNPQGPGWCRAAGYVDGQLCTMAVASVTNGSPDIVVSTIGSEPVPIAGETVVFPYITPAFKTTVSSVSGQNVVLASNYPGTTTSQAEFYAGSTFNTLEANISSSDTSLTTTLPTQPDPLAFSNVGTDGLIQIDSEIIGTHLVDYNNSKLLNLTRGMYGTTAASHTAGALIVPLNPYSPTTPQPIINSSGLFPANAEFYPPAGYNAGNAAISAPLLSGADGTGSFDHSLWRNLQINTLTGAENTGTVGIFLEQQPYYWTWKHISILGPQYGIIETIPVNSAALSDLGIDPGGKYYDVLIRTPNNAWLEFGRKATFADWDAYGSPNSYGAGIETGAEEYDGCSGGSNCGATGFGEVTFNNIYNEQNAQGSPIGYEPEQFYCASCTFNLMTMYGPYQQFYNISNSIMYSGTIGNNETTTFPTVMYGSNNQFNYVVDLNYSGQNSNVWGDASILSYGTGNKVNGQSGFIGGINFNQAGPGTVSPDFNVQSGDNLLTGNVDPDTWYINANSGIIYPLEFSSPTFDPKSFYTMLNDPTAPYGQALLCPVGQEICWSYNFDEFPTGGILIEPNSRITPQTYTVYVPYKVDSGTPTFDIHIGVSTTQINPPSPTNVATQTVTGSTSWQVAKFYNVDLSGYTGQYIGVSIDTMSDNTKRYYLGGLMMVPLAQNIHAANATIGSLTVTTSCSGCGGGSGISGLTANYIPLAGSATTITANSHFDDGVTTPGTITSSEPIAAPSGTFTGTGFPIKSGTASNSDLDGKLTLSGGSASYSFTSTGITTAPICTASDTTSSAAVKVTTTTTTLTITGTGSDVINYICVGLN